jgi:anti-anti-sigma regulatory factor
MSAPLSWSIQEHVAGTLVTVDGDLALASAPRLRLALMKALAEQPAAVLVDMAGMAVAEAPTLAVFTAVTRQAALWPAIPVLLCAPSSGVAALLAGAAHRRLPVFPTVAAGAAAATTARVSQPWVADELLPVRGAARYARDLATDTCLRWELPHLVWPASLVASELVSNAVQHAHTMVTLRFTLSNRYLHIAARDGSTAEPVLQHPPGDDPAGGRGLLLVQTLAAHWGSLPTDGGKVVWATLALGEGPPEPHRVDARRRV